MKRNLLYTAVLLLIVAQSAWAEYYPTQLGKPQNEGPWTFEDVSNGRANSSDKAFSFNGLNRYAWDARWSTGNEAYISFQFNDDDGIGFEMRCHSNYFYTRYAVYSLYSHTEKVPAYTRVRLTWYFSLREAASFYPQNVALYARDDMETMKNMNVDYTHDYSNKSGKEYMLANLVLTNPDHTDVSANTGVLTKTFDFDNRNGDTIQSKMWVLMLTHSVYNDDRDYPGATNTEDCIQWGSFRDEGDYKWATFYYKHVTFEANGGVGSMAVQEVENTQNLTANAFTRSGYAFAGWATTPNGFVVYADGAPITATIDNKGLDTLYAVWTPAPTEVIALIDAIGTVTYPDSKTAIDAARDAYDALDEEVKPYVSNYGKLLAAEDSYAVSKATALIEAIGTVTLASKDDIDAARAAYDALTLAEKTMVNNYSTLVGAEADFVELTKSSFVFMDKDAEPVGDSQRKSIDYPALPAGATEWQSVEKDVTDKTIVIKAVE